MWQFIVRSAGEIDKSCCNRMTYESAVQSSHFISLFYSYFILFLATMMGNKSMIFENTKPKRKEKRKQFGFILLSASQIHFGKKLAKYWNRVNCLWFYFMWIEEKNVHAEVYTATKYEQREKWCSAKKLMKQWNWIVQTLAFRFCIFAWSLKLTYRPIWVIEFSL